MLPPPFRFPCSLILTIALALFSNLSQAATVTITNDTFAKDTSGNPIYAQGGCIAFFGGKYYWYGVKYNGAVTYYNNPSAGKNSDTSFNAFTCYSSTDLANWTFEGNPMTSSSNGLAGSSWVGRMGVAHNSTTGKYVLISQFSGTNGSGELFATCSTPNGTFVYDHIQTSVPTSTGATGDQTVFNDTNGAAYLICSNSNGRAHLYVFPLHPADYLNVDAGTNISTGVGREGNCMFKYNGNYYFCSSDLHGWNASPCYVLQSSAIQGTYGAEYTMNKSALDFCHVSQTGLYISATGTAGTTVFYVGDRWCDFAGNGLGYNQWCPVSFSGTTPTFNSLSQISYNATASTWTAGASNNYILNPSAEADRVAQNVLAGWSNWTNLSGVDPYSNTSGGHTGRWAFEHTYTAAYQASTHQVVTGLTNGTYTLKAWVKSSGGQTTCQLFAKSFGGTEIDASINTAISSWTQKTVSTAINVTNGQVDVGVYSVANANNWVIVDDWTLTKN